jgi:single-stranded-DNA-specific exonuclease
MAGVGVALKLVCALETDMAQKNGEDTALAVEAILKEYADLAAIGTVADVMPLVDENRFIVMPGLRGVGKSTLLLQTYKYLIKHHL